MLYTTLNILHENEACASGYKTLRKSLPEKFDKDEPIPLLHGLCTNGLDDTLWALQFVHPDCETERDLISRLSACEFAEMVLPIFEKEFPNDCGPRKAIEVARKYAHGQASKEELETAKDAAKDAAKNIARNAAWAAMAAAWAAADTAAWAARDVAWNAVWDAAWAARAAAWAAAETAAWDAAWDGARDAADTAADTAAWDAARDAADTAADTAAWDAAETAAETAARDAAKAGIKAKQTEILFRLLSKGE